MSKILNRIDLDPGRNKLKDIKTRDCVARNRMTQLKNIWKDRNVTLDLKIRLKKCPV